MDPEDKACRASGGCKQVELCGPVDGQIVLLKSQSSGSSTRVTRGAALAAGEGLAAAASVGDAVCVVVGTEPQPFCIGVATKAQFVVAHDINSATGNAAVGDRMIRIRKLEPIAAGSHTYVVTDRALNVHSKFVRVGGLCLGEVARTAADAPLPTAANKRTGKYVEGAKWELDEDERVKIWSSIPH